MKKIFSCLNLLALSLLLALPLTAQQLQLLDAKHNLPIPDVFFLYGEESGLSNEQGMIFITYQEGQSLQLSHLNYGNILLNDEEVKHALEAGVWQLPIQVHALRPAEIVSLRPVQGRQQTQTIESSVQIVHDAGAYLAQLPGISTVRKSAAYGFDPVLRGFKNERLLILIDGVQSAHEACPNRMDPPASQIALNSMSSVDILKGPYSLRYGTAMGGIINFTSVKPQFTVKAEGFGRASAKYESNINALHTEAMAGLSGKNYDFRLFGAYAQGQDYTDGDGQTVQADFNRLNLGAQLALKAGEQHSFTLSFNNNHSEDVDFAALPMDLRKDDTRLFKIEHRFNSKQEKLKSWKTSAYLTSVDHLMDNLLKPLDPRMMNASTPATTLTYGGRSEQFWNFQQYSLYIGADFKSEEAEGSRIREFLMGPMAGNILEDNAWQHARIRQSSLFAEWHLPKGKNFWSLSARINYNQGEILDPADGFSQLYDNTTSTQINPSFSAGFTHSLNEQTSFGLWAGRVQRSPGISERYINFLAIGFDPYEMLGNPDLKPEKNNQVDLLFDWQNENIAFHFDAFAGLMQDYISSIIRPDLTPVIPSSPGVRQFINIDQASMAGFELGFRQMLPALQLQQYFSATYTYGQNMDTDEPLPEIPPLELRYILRGSHFKQQLQTEASFRYAFAQERIATSYGETTTPEFFVLDLAVSWQFGRFGYLRAGVNNVFDTAYYEHLNRSVRGDNPRPIYNPGRSFFLMLSANVF